MGKSVPAIVTPEVLKWARNLDSFSLDEIAGKLNVDVAKIEEWENGSSYPTLVQAKKLAKHYRVPFAYFYLPGIPQRTKRLEKIDYRTFGNWKITEMSRELRWFIRDIEERRDNILELYYEAELEPTVFDMKLSVESAEETIALYIRDLLELNNGRQSKFRKPEVALSHCIAKLEEHDFLIFQVAKVHLEEMRGLSVAYDIFPIIALNRKDEASARLFTLIHELVHIVTRTSGICNEMSQDSLEIGQMELFCNKIAGLTLVPSNELLQNKYVELIKDNGIEDARIRAIARDFAVSREVILHRLWDIGMIDKSTYFTVLNKYSEEYLLYKKNKKEKGFLPPALDKGSQLGKLYTRTIMSAYHTERITPLQTSSYLLGLRSKHFNAIERWCY